jgi:hypothetical protein
MNTIWNFDQQLSQGLAHNAHFKVVSGLMRALQVWISTTLNNARLSVEPLLNQPNHKI